MQFHIKTCTILLHTIRNDNRYYNFITKSCILITGYMHAVFDYTMTDGALTCFSIKYRDWKTLP